MINLKRKMVDENEVFHEVNSKDKLESIMNINLNLKDESNVSKHHNNRYPYKNNSNNTTRRNENYINDKRDRNYNAKNNSELKLALKESQIETKRLNELNSNLLNQLRAYENTIQEANDKANMEYYYIEQLKEENQKLKTENAKLAKEKEASDFIANKKLENIQAENFRLKFSADKELNDLKNENQRQSLILLAYCDQKINQQLELIKLEEKYQNIIKQLKNN